MQCCSLPQVVRRAAQALGYVCRGHAGSARVLGPAVEALLGLRTQKSEEVLFAVGEALCFAFGGERAAAYLLLAAARLLVSGLLPRLRIAWSMAWGRSPHKRPAVPCRRASERHRRALRQLLFPGRLDAATAAGWQQASAGC